MLMGNANVGMLGNSRDTSYVANAVRAGNSSSPSNYLTWNGQAEAYLVDSGIGSLSIWFNILGNSKEPNQTLMFSMAGAQFTLQRQDNLGDNSGGDTRLELMMNFGGSEQFTGKGVYLWSGTKFSSTVNPGWHHLLASWDVNHVNTSDFVFNYYIDDISDQQAGHFPQYSGGFGASSGPHVINWTEGAGSGSGGPSYPSQEQVPAGDVALAEMWLNTTTFIDFSITANRRKFRSAGGYPISLGGTGQLPTGTAPLYYLKNPAASWGTNSGTGINFIVNGSGQTDVTAP